MNTNIKALVYTILVLIVTGFTAILCNSYPDTAIWLVVKILKLILLGIVVVFVYGVIWVALKERASENSKGSETKEEAKEYSYFTPEKKKELLLQQAKEELDYPFRNNMPKAPYIPPPAKPSTQDMKITLSYYPGFYKVEENLSGTPIFTGTRTQCEEYIEKHTSSNISIANYEEYLKEQYKQNKDI